MRTLRVAVYLPGKSDHTAEKPSPAARKPRQKIISHRRLTMCQMVSRLGGDDSAGGSGGGGAGGGYTARVPLPVPLVWRAGLDGVFGCGSEGFIGTLSNGGR